MFSEQRRKTYKKIGVQWADKIYYSRTLFVTNYEQKTFLSLSAVYYDKSGNTLESIGADQQKEHIVPNSVVDLLMQKSLKLIGH